MAVLLLGAPLLGILGVFPGKDYDVKEETLSHGITKLTHTKKRKKWARYYLGVTTLGLSELHLTHEETEVEYVYNGNYLGETSSEASAAARKMAINFMEKKDFKKAEIYFDIALYLHPGNIDKKEIEKEKNNACAESAFEDANRFLEGDNFDAAVTSLKKAIQFSSFGDRRRVFEERCNNAKAEILCREGNGHFGNSNYMSAKQCFDDASQMTTNTDRRRYFQTQSRNAEFERLYNNAEIILRKPNLTREDYDAARRDAVAASRCSDNYANKQKFLNCIENIDNALKAIDAAEIFETGMTLLKQAWDHENRDKYDEAKAGFEQAHLLLKQAAGRFRNSMYEQYAEAVRFKISGNEAYTRGVQLFNEGHKYKNVNYRLAQQKYQEANTEFNSAINLFCQGEAQDITNKSNFQSCVRYVESMRTELEKAICNTEIAAVRPNPDEHVHDEVQNHTNDLVIFQTNDMN